MKRRVSVLALMLAAILVVAGCTGKSTTKSGDEVKIRITSGMVGTHPSAESFAWEIEQFNTAYEGKYEAVVEELPGSTNFGEKMRVMLTAGDVPDIIFPVDNDYLTDAVAAKLILPLDEYLDADPEWKASISEDGLELNSRDGKIYAVPRNRTILGYFYNKEHFEQVGIKPAETWEEFWANCDKLKAAGITPIAMEPTSVGEVLFSAILASADDEGFELVNGGTSPTKFDSPAMIESLNTLRDAYVKYGPMDGTVAKYENAANRFMNSQASIIANGIWMVNDFEDPNKAPEGFVDKVGVASFPGVICSYPALGIGIGAKTEEKIEASLACLKMFTSPERQSLHMGVVGEFPDSPAVGITEELMKEKPMMAQLWEIHNDVPIKTNILRTYWHPVIIETLNKYLPQFANGEIDANEVAKLLTREAENLQN